MLQAELEKMLATIRLLQAKNASTGTMSMSKKLSALQEAFSHTTVNNAPGQPPLLALPNGDVNKNKNGPVTLPQKPVSNPCVSVPNNKSSYDKTVSSDGVPVPSKPSDSLDCKPTKPNTLILVPNQKSIHQLSNGLLKSSEECGEVRLVHQPGVTEGQAKEVQASFSPLEHNEDCPFKSTPNNKSSDPFSECSDDYLESAVPDDNNKGLYSTEMFHDTLFMLRHMDSI